MKKAQILFLSANPRNATYLRVDQEYNKIEREIRLADRRDSIKLTPCFATEPEDAVRALATHKPVVLHFSGHGTTSSQIALQDTNGLPKLVTQEALVRLIEAVRGNIRLVFLNACSSHPQAEALSKTIDCTIGMKRPISDPTAILFAASFYHALGSGRSVFDAFGLAKGLLLMMQNPETDIPVLCIRDGINASEVLLVPEVGGQDANGENHAPGAYLTYDVISRVHNSIANAKDLSEVIWQVGTACLGNWTLEKARDLGQSYAKLYEERHGQVKILGMSRPVPLSSIYTEVSIANPESIKYYNDPSSMVKLFRSRKNLLESSPLAEEATSGLNVANSPNHQYLTILGAPGSGKSTFLRFVGLKAANPQSHSGGHDEVDQGVVNSYRFTLIPVLIDLKSLQNSPCGITSTIEEKFCSDGFPNGFGLAALATGGLLVLLDGIDEVDETSLARVLSQVQHLVDTYPKCRYITSCRTAFYKDYLNRFTDVILTDFTASQVRSFIFNWFQDGQERPAAAARRLWDHLQTSEHSPTLELASTPLLAAFVCLVFARHQRLPSNRAELLGDALRILTEEWSHSKQVHNAESRLNISARTELLMLESLAASSYEANCYVFTSKELAEYFENYLKESSEKDGRNSDQSPSIDGLKILSDIEGKKGLLVERTYDRYTFSHLVIHEYLAACHYHKSGRSEFVAGRIWDYRWREVCLFTAGIQSPNSDDYLYSIARGVMASAQSPFISAARKWASYIIDPSLPAADAAVLRSVAFVMYFFRYLFLTQVAEWSSGEKETRLIPKLIVKIENIAQYLAPGRVESVARCTRHFKDAVLLDSLYISPFSLRKAALGFMRSFIDAGMPRRDRLEQCLRCVGSAPTRQPSRLPLNADSQPESLLDSVIEPYERALNLEPSVRQKGAFSPYEFKYLSWIMDSTILLLKAHEASARVTPKRWDDVCSLLFADRA